MERPHSGSSGAGEIRVLHVSSERGWRGGERQLLLLVGALGERLRDQAVAAPAGSELVRRAVASGWEAIALPGTRPWSPSSIRRLRGWLRDHPGAVLHAHTSPALDAARLLRALSPVGGVVYTRRTVFPLRRGRKYTVAADRYVAVAGAVAERLAGAGADPDRVVVIPSVVEVAAADAAPELADGSQRRRGSRVLCVAALAPEKRHDLLLRAWTVVVGTHPEAELVLIGDGPERSRVEAAAGRLPEGAVRIVGHREDVWGWIKSADLVVLCSDSEGIGGALLEAMACSKPVVATAVGGVPEVVEHGTTGLLTPPGDPLALAAAVLEVLAEPARGAEMGRAGRQAVEARFSPRSAADAHLRVYREALHDAAGPT